MVAVSGIQMDHLHGRLSRAAAAFPLSIPTRRDRLHAFREDWEVELKRGSGYVVVRTSQELQGAPLLDGMISMVQRALDLSCLEDGDRLSATLPTSQHVMLFTAGDRRTVRIKGICDFPFSMSVHGVHPATYGKPKPDASPPHRDWSPAFRFYRLSQTSSDPFEAYRNLFLGLEALLDQLFPKQDEGEKKWLVRAVSEAGKKLDLSRIASQLAGPTTGNAPMDLVNALYPVRLNLFHAKINRVLVPDEPASYVAVANAFPILQSLWRGIVHHFLAPLPGGGGLTHSGFSELGEFFKTARVGVGADDSPFDKAETQASPLGLPFHVLSRLPSGYPPAGQGASH